MEALWYERLNNAASNPKFDLQAHIPNLDLYATIKDHEITQAKLTGVATLVGLAGLALSWDRGATFRQNLPQTSTFSISTLLFGYLTISGWRRIKEVDEKAYNSAVKDLQEQKSHFPDV